jgi:predicted enzyme related to lactoylglutathione lyase
LFYSQKVDAAGGKKRSEIEPEGDHGLMQHFADTEGNYLGMYMQKPKEDK